MLALEPLQNWQVTTSLGRGALHADAQPRQLGGDSALAGGDNVAEPRFGPGAASERRRSVSAGLCPRVPG